MRIKNLVEEDFVNYKKPAMFVGFPKCSFKCEREYGMQCCQNSKLGNAPTIEITHEEIIERYINNAITKSFVFGGLEPFDSLNDLMELIEKIRRFTNDDIVIYTGYQEKEMQTNFVQFIKSNQYENIIIKFGRYVPDQQSHYDPVLGVYLASDNQYAKQVS